MSIQRIVLQLGMFLEQRQGGMKNRAGCWSPAVQTIKGILYVSQFQKVIVITDLEKCKLI